MRTTVKRMGWTRWLCLKSRTSDLETVSTGSDSDLVSDRSLSLLDCSGLLRLNWTMFLKHDACAGAGGAAGGAEAALEIFAVEEVVDVSKEA